MNRSTDSVLALAMLSAVGAAFATAQAASSDGNAYNAGTRALDEQRWTEAVADFDRVAGDKGKRADAALYWKAYALNKLRRGSLVAATCAQLQSTYASSSWNRDCGALTVVNSGEPPVDDHSAQESGTGARSSDADLKMLALNSLMNRDPARAMPYVKALLSGDAPPETKERAIFILAQSGAPEAQQLLRDMAVMGTVSPALQTAAIRMYGIFHGKQGNSTLAEVYQRSTDRGVKRAVVTAFFITGDAPRMVDLARNEKDVELKRSIVSQLALMQDKAATDYMLELLK